MTASGVLAGSIKGDRKKWQLKKIQETPPETIASYMETRKIKSQ
jgi:hypothetical protein